MKSIGHHRHEDESGAFEQGAKADTGGIPAGVHKDERGPEVLAFFAVDDLDQAAKRVVELGGEVDEIGDESEGGRYLYSCRDDQGIQFGLHQRPG